MAGIRRPVFWGLYLVDFVFWIGISHAGTLISAILRLTDANWRKPVTRAAEAITVFALMIGGMFPLIHLGRVWLFYWLFPYPNSRLLWPNFRSPSDVGCDGDFHLFDGQPDFSLPPIDSRRSAIGRERDRLAFAALPADVTGLEREAIASGTRWNGR